MCILSRGCVAAVLLILLHAGHVQAQRPPKYVRTPYVEVYRDEFGGKHIRTPFAEIHKPGRIPPALLGPPVYAVPVGPPQATMPQQSYRAARPTSVPRAMSQPTPARDLRAYPASSGDRLRQQLLVSSTQLAQALERFDTAVTWLRYFSLTPGGTLAPGQSLETAAPDTAELVKLLGKFDSVARNPAYSMIAELPEFQQTYQWLNEVIAEQPQSGQAPAEELPAPEGTLSPEV